MKASVSVSFHSTVKYYITTLKDALLHFTQEVANNFQEHNIRARSSEIMLKLNQTGNHKLPPSRTSICPVKMLHLMLPPKRQ